MHMSLNEYTNITQRIQMLVNDSPGAHTNVSQRLTVSAKTMPKRMA